MALEEEPFECLDQFLVHRLVRSIGVVVVPETFKYLDACQLRLARLQGLEVL